MNRKMLKRFAGSLVQLQPKPLRTLPECFGRPSPYNQWRVKKAESGGLLLHNISTDHDFTLPHDHIQKHVSGLEGRPSFLLLHIQLWLEDLMVRVEPIKRSH